MSDIKHIPIDEFRALGYLQEVNRLVLHPCGLALEVTVVDREFLEKLAKRIEPLVRAELVSWGGVSEPDHLDALVHGIAGSVLGEFYGFGGEFISGVWDYRDDGEGILYGEGQISGEKARTVREERVRHNEAREKIFDGAVIQPVPDA